MPTLLPPRVPASKRDQSEFSAPLSIVAGMLALLLVFAEAQAVGAIEFGPLSSDPPLIVPP